MTDHATPANREATQRLYPDQNLVGSPRKLYYNPAIDHAEDYTNDAGPLLGIGPFGALNLVSSMCEDGWHCPALDIDHNDVDELTEITRLIINHIGFIGTMRPLLIWQPSANNWHCYIPNVILEWPVYLGFMQALADDGEILQPEYVEHSKDRGQSLLRLPGVPKVALAEGVI